MNRHAILIFALVAMFAGSSFFGSLQSSSLGSALDYPCTSNNPTLRLLGSTVGGSDFELHTVSRVP